MIADSEQQLLAALSQAFGRKCFDTSSVLGRVWHANDLKLAKALDAAIPNCRYRSGYWHGHFKDGAVRHVLTRLAPQHFDTDRYGWWYLKSIQD
jgi:hypothetical protein